MKKFFIGLLALLSIQNFAIGGDRIGNGGGAWVCRENTGDIRWSKLVDLFEATDEFGLTLTQHTGTTKDIVDLMQLRVFRADINLYQALAPYIEKINYLSPNPPQVVYTEGVLQTIDDSLFRLIPSPRSCNGGRIAFEQTVNYKNDNLILVQSELFNSLSTIEKAALIFHEALYKYRRDKFMDKNSLTTRRIIGLIFSDLSVKDLVTALNQTGSSADKDKYTYYKYDILAVLYPRGNPRGELPLGYMPQHMHGFRFTVIKKAQAECDGYNLQLDDFKNNNLSERVKNAIELIMTFNMPDIEKMELINKLNSAYTSGRLLHLYPYKFNFRYDALPLQATTTCELQCKDDSGSRYCLSLENILRAE